MKNSEIRSIVAGQEHDGLMALTKRDSKGQVIQHPAVRSSQKDLFVRVPIPGGCKFIRARDIYYVQADGNYCTVHTVDGINYIMSKPIKNVAERVSELDFMRVHQSYVVRLKSIKSVTCKDGSVFCKMENGEMIPVSRRNKNALLARLC